MNTPSSSSLTVPPMELSEEDRQWALKLWENRPPENVIYLSKEEYDKFVDKLNNPPAPNERLVKLMTETSALDRGGDTPTRHVVGELLDQTTSDAVLDFAKKQTTTPIYRHDSNDGSSTGSS